MILATDNFTRADSTGLGANWTVVTSEGSFDIHLNKALCHDKTVDSCEFYNGVVWPNDQYAEITVAGIQSPGQLGAGLGCLVRASASAQTYYRAFATGSGGQFQLKKRIAGVGTTLATAAGSVVLGDVIRLEAIGTTLNVYKNGVLVIGPVTDASIASGNAGIHYSSADTNPDDISLFAGGNFQPAVQSIRRPRRVVTTTYFPG